MILDIETVAARARAAIVEAVRRRGRCIKRRAESPQLHAEPSARPPRQPTRPDEGADAFLQKPAAAGRHPRRRGRCDQPHGGPPGSGKTILAEQYMFHNATEERPGLCLSTVSEPLEKLMRYGQNLDFFNPDTVGGR